MRRPLSAGLSVMGKLANTQMWMGCGNNKTCMSTAGKELGTVCPNVEKFPTFIVV
jgi:hypothetical protein